MFRRRILQSRAERRRFLDQFCEQLARRSEGALVLDAPVDRIAHCTRVVGVFDRRGEMVAGYIVNEHEPLALLDVVPKAERGVWAQRARRRQLCELNLIWRNSGIGHAAFAVWVWPRIVIDCVRRGRPFILGSGYRNPLDRWYRMLEPELLYEGPSATSGLPILVYAFTRSRLVGTYVVSVLDSFVAGPWRRRRRSAR